mmetsp:Transcript_13159/g.33615  ORF Transcript_13159/g.33615 Transcript_13159/m.33615 type:complete len:234 (+) Transcript_13159:522-1223(+)
MGVDVLVEAAVHLGAVQLALLLRLENGVVAVRLVRREPRVLAHVFDRDASLLIDIQHSIQQVLQLRAKGSRRRVASVGVQVGQKSPQIGVGRDPVGRIMAAHRRRSVARHDRNTAVVQLVGLAAGVGVVEEALVANFPPLLRPPPGVLWKPGAHLHRDFEETVDVPSQLGVEGGAADDVQQHGPERPHVPSRRVIPLALDVKGSVKKGGWFEDICPEPRRLGLVLDCPASDLL